MSSLWSREPSASSIAKRLAEAKQEGVLLISGIVYAELLAHPKATESFVNTFMNRTGIVLDLKLQDAVWLEAGIRFVRYAKRRCKAESETPKRLLADFLVGAHALMQADRLFTLDPVRYRRDFPELTLFES